MPLPGKPRLCLIDVSVVRGSNIRPNCDGRSRRTSPSPWSWTWHPSWPPGESNGPQSAHITDCLAFCDTTIALCCTFRLLWDKGSVIARFVISIAQTPAFIQNVKRPHPCLSRVYAHVLLRVMHWSPSFTWILLLPCGFLNVWYFLPASISMCHGD